MSLKIGDRVFETKTMTLNDWVEAEEKGLDLKRLQKGEVGMKDVRLMAWIVAKKAQPEITIEAIGELITLDNMPLVMGQIGNFIAPKGSTATETISDTLTSSDENMDGQKAIL